MTDWIEHVAKLYSGDDCKLYSDDDREGCPVDGETLVDVWYRCGMMQPATKAGEQRWYSHPSPLANPHFDIVAYRLADQKPWIEHDGSMSPVPPETFVEVEVSGQDSVEIRAPAPARTVAWSAVTLYRPSNPTQEPTP
jgi:hypothetical protein